MVHKKGGAKMEHENSKTFVDREKVKSVMCILGLNQLTLSERTNIPKSSLSRKLSGATEFTESEIVELQKVLGKNIFLTE